VKDISSPLITALFQPGATPESDNFAKGSHLRDELSPAGRRDHARLFYWCVGKLQRVLDGCGILRADFVEVEKTLFDVGSKRESE